MESQLLEIIQNLSLKVEALYADRERTNTHQEHTMDMQEQDFDPYAKTRAPQVEIEAYPELMDAIPNMKEDFFRSPLTDEERKEIIYGQAK
ncbi:hypothetical protein AYI70_g276, partial [Smittium culicis]